MSGLVTALLLGPLAVTVATVAVPRRAARITGVAAVVAAAGWVVVAAAEVPVETGDLRIDGLLAAASAGLAALVAGRPAPRWFGATAGALALTVFPVAGALEPTGLPERWLGVGVVALAALALVHRWGEATAGIGNALVLVAGLIIAGGLIGHDPAEVVGLGVAGTLVATLAALVWGRPGQLLLPAGALAVARGAALRTSPDGTDWVLVVTSALLAVVVVVLVAVPGRSVVRRLPLAAGAAGAGLLALDVVELRQAGALLVGGAVLALLAAHPLALVALLPGTAAAVGAAGLATEPEHALVGAGALAVLLVAVVGDWRADPTRRSAEVPAAVAVAFGVLPAWGWSGADTGAYGDTVVVAAATAAIVVVWRLGPRPRMPVVGRGRRSAPVTAVTEGGDGRLDLRPTSGASHGPALEDVDLLPEDAQRQAGGTTPS